jgi:hypothetical protein
MPIRKITLFFIISLVFVKGTDAQTAKVQRGMVMKLGGNVRLGGVQLINTRNRAEAKSNIYGFFSIEALAGDTLQFSDSNFQNADFVVNDFTDKIVYMEPIIQLDEVVVKENSIQKDISDVQRGYRSKSVFYTGTPHYYYLMLKPMTFIYENFKSEVINARKFNRYAAREMTSIEIAKRFNERSIKAVVPIKDKEVEEFEDKFTPTLQQLNRMNNYELINYIRKSYEDFENSKINAH